MMHLECVKIFLFVGKRIDVLVSAVKQGPDVGRQMEYMLATGNVVSRSSLSLPQVISW